MRNIREKIRELFELEKKKNDNTAIMLSGGGARAAYQVGVLQYVADAFPDVWFSILTGVSAGAINVGQLANNTGSFRLGAEKLMHSWRSLTAEHVFRSESTLAFFRKLLLNGSGRSNEERITSSMAHQRGLADTSPLRNYLIKRLQIKEDGKLFGIDENVQRNRIKGVAFTTTNYSTGQLTTFLQGCNISGWIRPNRVSKITTLSVDHIMASAALPIIFPAVFIDGMWYGDGGVRLTTPLSPPINMGADKIFVISTRYNRSKEEADTPSVHGYPPAAQIIGILMNAIFLDVLDHDALRLERINELLEELPPHKWNGLKPIKLLLIRPSRDLGHLAKDFKTELSGALGLFTQGIGSDETDSPDWMSMLLFHKDYIERLMEIGYDDAAHQHDEIEEFFAL